MRNEMGQVLKCLMFGLVMAVIAISMGCGTQALQEEEQTSEVPQAADPFVGTWQLDVEKSTFDPGSARGNLTRTIEDRGDGFFLMTREGIDAEGNRTFSRYAYKRDGKDYPFPSLGAEAPQSLSITLVDAHTEEHVRKADGKVTATSTGTVSKDGKTMTGTNKGTTHQGQRINTVMVYDRH